MRGVGHGHVVGAGAGHALQQRAELIAEISRRPALEWRHALDRFDLETIQLRLQQIEEIPVDGFAVHKGLAVLDGEHAVGIGGKEGIAAVIRIGARTIQKGQPALAAEHGKNLFRLAPGNLDDERNKSGQKALRKICVRDRLAAPSESASLKH